MKAARCPRCGRLRVVVGVKRPRIRQHPTSKAVDAPLCPGSGTPIRTTDLQELPR